MMPQRNPAPPEWRAEQYADERWRVREFKGRKMVRVIAINLDEPTARLIAAAPDLAEALERLVNTVDPGGPYEGLETYFSKPCEKARAALKAAGRAPQ